jgi:hypothetical protein
LLPREREATGRWVRHKLDTWPSGQPRRKLAIESPIQSGDFLMSVVPSIIVLMITALLVFRREIIAWSATGLKPVPGAEPRPLHQATRSARPPARRPPPTRLADPVRLAAPINTNTRVVRTSARPARGRSEMDSTATRHDGTCRPFNVAEWRHELK